jgi:hypothetical protein
MKLKTYFQIFAFIAVIFLLYISGLALHLIIIIGIIIFLSMILRGRLYKKVDELTNKKLHFLSRLHPWMKKIIFILVFILVYFIVKEIVLAIMKSLGMDLEKIMLYSINKTVGNN